MTLSWRAGKPVKAQQDLTSELGIQVEAAGAAAWAACVADAASRSASLIVITGSNVRTEQLSY